MPLIFEMYSREYLQTGKSQDYIRPVSAYYNKEQNMCTDG